MGILNGRSITRRRGLVTAAVLVSALGLVVGCSSGAANGSSDQGSGQSTPTAESTANADPIRIGGITDVTGGLAPLGVAQKQMGELAVKYLNDHGGVLGRQVEMEYLDGETDPAKWAQRAQELTDKSMVIGGLTGAERNAIIDVLSDTIFITPGFTESPQTNCRPYVFGAGAVPNQFVIPLVNYMVENSGGKTVYMMGSDYDFPRGANAIAKQRFEELGVKVLDEVYYPLDETSFAPSVNVIAEQHPDMVFSNVIPPTSYTLVKQLHEAGLWDSFVFGTPGSDEGWIAGGGENVYGMLANMDYFDSVDLGTSKDIREAYYSAYGHKYPISSAGSATGVYRGIMLWAAAVEEAGTTDVAKVLVTLDHAKTDNAPGGPAAISPGTHNTKLTSFIGQLGANGVEIVETVDPVDPPACE